MSGRPKGGTHVGRPATAWVARIIATDGHSLPGARPPAGSPPLGAGGSASNRASRFESLPAPWPYASGTMTMGTAGILIRRLSRPTSSPPIQPEACPYVKPPRSRCCTETYKVPRKPGRGFRHRRVLLTGGEFLLDARSRRCKRAIAVMTGGGSRIGKASVRICTALPRPTRGGPSASDDHERRM
jgi:hypothetical protein